MSEYNAEDFLELYLEFRALSIHYSIWDEQALQDSPERYYRYLQSVSLMKAFGLGTNLRSALEHGRFINDREDASYKAIFDDIRKFVEQSPQEDPKQQDATYNVHEIEWIYRKFMDFLVYSRDVIYYNKNWQEAGMVFARYIIHKTNDFIQKENLYVYDEIKRIVCLIIDPEERTFTKAELIRDFDFPEVDLNTIDAKTAKG